MNIDRLHIAAFLGVAALVWFVVLFCQGTPVTWDHGRPFGAVISALAVMGLLLEFALWRQAWLHGWFVKRPDLRGTWRVVLQSSYVRPDTGESVPPITCFMGVTQTLSSLKLHLMTPESESWSVSAQVIASPNGSGFQIAAVYTNEPRVDLRSSRVSEMHQGALVIETHGSTLRPTSLTAKYWTDRNTSGTMEFSDRATEVYTRFSDAKAAMATTKP